MWRSSPGWRQQSRQGGHQITYLDLPPTLLSSPPVRTVAMVSTGTMTEPQKLDWSPVPAPQERKRGEPPTHPPLVLMDTPAIPPPQKQKAKRRHLHREAQLERLEQSPDSGSEEDLPAPQPSPSSRPLEDLPLLRLPELNLAPRDPDLHTAAMVSSLLDLTMEELQEIFEGKDLTPSTDTPASAGPKTTFNLLLGFMDCFPGAKWKHAEAILIKAKITCPVEKLVLSFGLNNRNQREKRTALRELQATLRAVSCRFPGPYCPKGTRPCCATKTSSSVL
ncbi:hypothetical protein GOODEAATRI_027577 [Goodea atripinnis]|uniref:Uncharacterized protein n=1 Tax=Goodea atripinnis TaxID=208336 RepID=A0ABV0ML84_9TELE